MGGKEKTRWGLETEMEAIWFSKNSKKKTKRERNEIEKEDSTFHCFSKVVVLEHGFFFFFCIFYISRNERGGGGNRIKCNSV